MTKHFDISIRCTPSLSVRFLVTTILVIFIGLLYSLQLIPHRKYANADFNIETYLSQNDQDQDGIDDQTDILESARAYLATKPKYKSIYYATGYPDDDHGVCTDVVAFALKGAGYDLRELLEADIEASTSVYDIEIPDKNIDFRRVKNLQVWFSRHAQSLTTDTSQISEWQGGDIVVFPDHIGLISNHRNREGKSFLIHHYSPFQVTYEEDVLDHYGQIIGHFRMS